MCGSLSCDFNGLEPIAARHLPTHPGELLSVHFYYSYRIRVGKLDNQLFREIFLQ